MAPAFFPLPLLTLVFVLVLASSVRAGVNVQPSNNTQDLAWTNSVQFRFAGDSGPLAGHTLVPLTPFLVDLTENQLKVSLAVDRLRRCSLTGQLNPEL